MEQDIAKMWIVRYPWLVEKIEPDEETVRDVVGNQKTTDIATDLPPVSVC